MILTGVIQEIKTSDQIPKTTLFLEPRGKFTIEIGVNSSKATGLKKGDTVKLKADCTGPGHSANEGKILCTGVILKDDEAPRRRPLRSRSDRARGFGRCEATPKPSPGRKLLPGVAVE